MSLSKHFFECNADIVVVRLLLGFMLTSGVLSMWISNTATSTMMIPIAKAVMEEISRETTRNDEEADELMEPEGLLRFLYFGLPSQLRNIMKAFRITSTWR